MHYGSLEWARSTRGRLVGLERIGQLLGAIRYQVAGRLRRHPRAAGFATAAEAARALDETELPQTPVVAATLQLVTTLGPQALVGHVLRTQVWGTLLGLRDGLQWDRELHALAALLHDLALARREPSRCCFAQDGAEQSLAFLVQQGVAAERRDRIADAVCLHLRTEVPVALGVEAHLVHAGAGLDVIGRRASTLAEPVRAAVLARYPRGDLAPYLLRTLGAEASRYPDSRIAHWMGLGFGGFIRRNPLDRPPAAPDALSS